LGGNTLVANALSCYCPPCFDRNFEECESRHLRPESSRVCAVVSCIQTGETLRSRKELRARGFEFLDGMKSPGGIVAIYVRRGDRGTAGLDEDQVLCSGRFILAELPEVFDKQESLRASRTRSLYRSKAEIKVFYTKERVAESTYFFEEKNRCKLLGPDVLVPYSQCGPKGPSGECLKKHFEMVDVEYVLSPGVLKPKIDYNMQDRRRGPRREFTIELTPVGFDKIVKGLIKDEQDHAHFLNCL